MPPAMERLDAVLNKIDRLNSQDPNKVTADGKQEPFELAYAKRLSVWVQKLKPDASEALRIAARGQHVQRWTIPRDRYPMNRGGYLRWREDLKKFHAETVGNIMAEAGYAEDEIARVKQIISKKGIKEDPEIQALEDGLCLVFFEMQFVALRRKTPDDKMKDILQKTWKKMSAEGQKMALALPLDQSERAFVAQSLGL